MGAEAVERTVHRHLDEQLEWLGGRDPQLSAAIAAIQTQEEGCVAWAAERRPPPTAMTRALERAVEAVVEALIWLSTQGESGRLRAEVGDSSYQ